MREQSAWKKRIALKAAFDQIDALSGSDQTDNDEVIGIAANKSHFFTLTSRCHTHFGKGIFPRDSGTE